MFNVTPIFPARQPQPVESNLRALGSDSSVDEPLGVVITLEEPENTGAGGPPTALGADSDLALA